MSDGLGTPQQENAFREVKSLLSSDCLLVDFDPTKKLILSCDASPYGLGAVLSDEIDDGREKPIAFASRSLSPGERNYSHLEKEASALIVGVKIFHKYCYGRHFEAHSDHKPLLGISAEGKKIPEMTAARLQRWTLLLAGYDYSLVYKPGRDNNADGLSRLPLEGNSGSQLLYEDELGWANLNVMESDGVDIMMMELDQAPVTAEAVKSWSRQDPVIAKVIDLVLTGWAEGKY